MEQRADYIDDAQTGFKKVIALEMHTQSAVPKELLELIKLRASYLNGCTYCIDMHSTDAMNGGEDVRRLFAVAAWEESPWFTDAERATFALTDALTTLGGGVADEVWDATVEHFGESGTLEIVLAISTINVWNRLNIAIRRLPPPLAA